MLEACIPKSIESMKPYLKSGIPYLNIRSLEPFDMKDISLKIRDQIITNITLTDIHFFGITDYDIRNVE